MSYEAPPELPPRRSRLLPGCLLLILLLTLAPACAAAGLSLFAP